MVYLLTDNILFSSKILQTLKSNGLEARAFGSPEMLDTALAEGQPNVLMVNLNARGFDPAAVVRRLKAEAFAPPIIGFCGHSDAVTRQAGLDAGADRVLANSAVTMNAAQALRSAGVVE